MTEKRKPRSYTDKFKQQLVLLYQNSKTKCPYGLDTPALLQKNYQDYAEVLVGKPL